MSLDFNELTFILYYHFTFIVCCYKDYIMGVTNRVNDVINGVYDVTNRVHDVTNRINDENSQVWFESNVHCKTVKLFVKFEKM